MENINRLISCCAHCKKVKDDRGVWVEFNSNTYNPNTDTVTHGICGACAEAIYAKYLKTAFMAPGVA